jgi:hypothetical protein
MLHMLEKARLVAALNEHDEHAAGVRKSSFLQWVTAHKDWERKEYGHICKLLEDCIDDNWIGTSFKKEYDPNGAPKYLLGEPTEYPTRDVEYVFVRSKGREMLKWQFFIPAVLEKMSLKEIATFAICTGLGVSLAAFGFHNL